MKTSPAPQVIEKLVSVLSRRYGNDERTGIHVSDLLLCLRRSYYTKTNPKQPSPETLGYFVDGSRRDFVIKGLFGARVSPSEKDGIWFTPDALDENGNPIEIKTTRASQGISPHYITQLAYYMVLLGKNKGRLIVQRVGFRKNNIPFEAYDFEFESGDLERYRQEMFDRRDSLENSFDLRDAGLVPSVRSDLQFNWLCKGCPWDEDCKKVDEGISTRCPSQRLILNEQGQAKRKTD
jgi:hypothetical protein